MAEQDPIAMGEQAERLLNDPTFKDALIKVEAKYVAQWRNSGLTDSLGREKAFLLLKALSDVFTEIKVTISGGQVAKAQLSRSQRRS